MRAGTEAGIETFTGTTAAAAASRALWRDRRCSAAKTTARYGAKIANPCTPARNVNGKYHSDRIAAKGTTGTRDLNK